MLSVSELADKINEAIGATDGEGNPIDTTPEMTAYAQAVISTLQAAIVMHTPGSVDAIAPPVPGPVLNGSASNGMMTLVSAIWTAALASGFPTADSSKLSSEATASTGYLMSEGKVNFPSGSINGVSTATPVSPGTLTLGFGIGGKIEEIAGNPWSEEVVGSQGLPNTDVAKAIYTAIADYVLEKAEAAYATGSVNGVFSPGGGPMTAGNAVGGTIS